VRGHKKFDDGFLEFVVAKEALERLEKGGKLKGGPQEAQKWGGSGDRRGDQQIPKTYDDGTHARRYTQNFRPRITCYELGRLGNRLGSRLNYFRPRRCGSVWEVFRTGNFSGPEFPNSVSFRQPLLLLLSFPPFLALSLLKIKSFLLFAPAGPYLPLLVLEGEEGALCLPGLTSPLPAGVSDFAVGSFSECLVSLSFRVKSPVAFVFESGAELGFLTLETRGSAK
jgi:hypothetical protein